jgi:uncharacterized protein (UPF0335 family)
MAEVGGIDNERLKSLIERIEHLEEEKKGISGDIKDIYAEAKSAGFDVKALRHVIKQRARAKNERDEEKYIFELYENAVGLE